MKRHMKSSDGKYHINGKKYDILIGSRAQVGHGTAYKTKYGLKKDDLIYNKHGRFVSKKKHLSAKREKRLQKHGYFTQKGKFGAVKRGSLKSHTKHRKSKRGKRSTKGRRRR